uniref:Uncharacterized protein n=1 Tax=Sipha flava TaxID=143950 RepID=A0A2S2QIJ7_9HEMI
MKNARGSYVHWVLRAFVAGQDNIFVVRTQDPRRRVTRDFGRGAPPITAVVCRTVIIHSGKRIVFAARPHKSPRCAFGEQCSLVTDVYTPVSMYKLINVCTSCTCPDERFRYGHVIPSFHLAVMRPPRDDRLSDDIHRVIRVTRSRPGELLILSSGGTFRSSEPRLFRRTVIFRQSPAPHVRSSVHVSRFRMENDWKTEALGEPFSRVFYCLKHRYECIKQHF